jgi:hypothetical protein
MFPLLYNSKTKLRKRTRLPPVSALLLYDPVGPSSAILTLTKPALPPDSTHAEPVITLPNNCQAPQHVDSISTDEFHLIVILTLTQML